MKKLMILTLICLFLLTGCNEIKNAITQESTLQQTVDQIATIVDKRNALENKIENSEEIMAYDQAVEQFDQLYDSENPDTKLIDQILTNSAKIQSTLAASNVTLHEIEQEAKTMKTTLKDRLSTEDHAAVQKTLDHFITLVSTEIAYTNTSIKFYTEIEKMYRDIKNGIEPSEEVLIQMEKELETTEKKLDIQVGIFNQSWNTVHKDARGIDLEDPQ